MAIVPSFQQCIREAFAPEDNMLTTRLYSAIADFDSAFDGDKTTIVWLNDHVKHAMEHLWKSKGPELVSLFKNQEYVQRMGTRRVARKGRPALSIGEKDAPKAFEKLMEIIRKNDVNDARLVREVRGGVQTESYEPRPHLVRVSGIPVVFTQTKIWNDAEMGDSAQTTATGKTKLPWQLMAIVDPEDMSKLIDVIKAVPQKIEEPMARERKSSYAKKDMDAPSNLRGKATAMTLAKAAKEVGMRRGPEGVEMGSAPANLYPKVKAAIAAGQLKWGNDGMLSLVESIEHGATIAESENEIESLVFVPDFASYCETREHES